jgi:hypothetical protein
MWSPLSYALVARRGTTGGHVLRRELGTGSREYGIVRRFSNPEFGDRFYRSSLLQQWELAVAQFTEGDRGARSCPARKPGSPCPASGR